MVKVRCQDKFLVPDDDKNYIREEACSALKEHIVLLVATGDRWVRETLGAVTARHVNTSQGVLQVVPAQHKKKHFLPGTLDHSVSTRQKGALQLLVCCSELVSSQNRGRWWLFAPTARCGVLSSKRMWP